MGEGAGNALDISAATAALTQMQTAVEGYWEAAQPAVLAIIGVALVATLIWVGYKLIHKGSNKIG